MQILFFQEYYDYRTSVLNRLCIPTMGEVTIETEGAQAPPVFKIF